MTEREEIFDMAGEILQKTNDGNNLSPQHLKLVENAVNNFLNEKGIQVFKELYKNVKNGYKKPFLHNVENITIDNEGYVYYKDKQIEHFEFDYAFSKESEEYTKELAKRCKDLENKGIEINSSTVVWNWESIS